MYCNGSIEAFAAQHGLESPFQELCDICITNDKFADDLLNHQTIRLDTFAEYLNLTAPTVASHKRNQFKYICCRMLLSDMLTVAEEAFALLIVENSFELWKWSADKGGRKELGQVNADSSNKTSSPDSNSLSTQPESPDSQSSLSVSSSSRRQCSLQQGGASMSQSSVEGDDEDLPGSDDDDDNGSAQVVPGHKYQFTQVRSDKKPGAGPWTAEGMDRYNAIVERVRAERKVRGRFEELLRTYYREQDQKFDSGVKSNKRRTRRGDSDDDASPKKVVVVDLFTCDSDDA